MSHKKPTWQTPPGWNNCLWTVVGSMSWATVAPVCQTDKHRLQIPQSAWSEVKNVHACGCLMGVALACNFLTSRPARRIQSPAWLSCIARFRIYWLWCCSCRLYVSHCGWPEAYPLTAWRRLMYGTLKRFVSFRKLPKSLLCWLHHSVTLWHMVIYDVKYAGTEEHHCMQHAMCLEDSQAHSIDLQSYHCATWCNSNLSHRPICIWHTGWHDMSWYKLMQLYKCMYADLSFCCGAQATCAYVHVIQSTDNYFPVLSMQHECWCVCI